MNSVRLNAFISRISESFFKLEYEVCMLDWMNAHNREVLMQPSPLADGRCVHGCKAFAVYVRVAMFGQRG